MGSQRIVSKIGDLESFGADPRRVVYAGHDVDGIDEVDFAGKYQTATGNIKERYQSFDLEYKGEENNDYVNGQGFCCTDNPLGRDGARTVSDTKDGETPERLIYFYHSDHLGSSSLITNFDGEVTQHVEYIPYGEVFLEERNNTWNTPYLFNAKELDEETGLYYYGARYLNPMDAMWLSVDPMTEKYPGVSGYLYCLGNPIIIIDPDGKDVYAKKNSDSSLTYAVTGRRTSDTYTSDGDTYYKIDNTYDIRDSKGNLKGLPTRRNENSKQNYGTPIYGQSSVEEEQKTKAKNTGSPIDPEALPTAESGDIIEFFQYVLKKVGLFENEKKTIPKSGSDVTHYTDEKSEFDILGGTGPYKVGRYTYHTGDTMGIRRIRTTAIFKKTRLVHIRRDTTYTVKKPRKR